VLGRSDFTLDTCQVPWVVLPHGGPHACGLDIFEINTALLLASGVAVCIPNYRGTIGRGRAYNEVLLGNAGVMDVADVAALTR